MIDGEPQPSDSAPSLASLQELDYFGQIEDFLHFRLRNRVAESVRSLGGCNIKEGAGEARAWDSVDQQSVG